MKKKFISKLVAVVCVCLTAQSMAAASPAEVWAEEVQEGPGGAEIQEADMPEEDSQGAPGAAEETDAAEGVKEAGGREEESTEAQAGRDDLDRDTERLPEEEKEEKKKLDAKSVLQAQEITENTKISFDESKEQILIEFKDVKTNKGKVAVEPLDGRFYYTGSNVKPKIQVYTIEEIAEDEDLSLIPEEERYESQKEGQEVKRYRKVKLLKEKTDYTVSYPKTCKALGQYTITVKAVNNSEEYEGTRKVSYEIIEKEHKWGDWKTTVKQTVFKQGEKQRTCSICKKTEKAAIAKAKATIKLNMKTIPLKVKQTTTKFKVSGLASGDYVKSYKSSNKKIFTVDKKGKIKAKKKGTAKLTVTLASGKKAAAKVKVQKGTVRTTKLTTNTSSLVLLKGGSYTLKTSLAPLTTQQKVTYSSSNKKVATVSSKGVIKARKKGTVTITAKSGSKKKKISVTVKVPSFPKGDGTAFLKSCQKIANTIMTDGNWIYYSGPGMKKSFAEARDYNPRQTSCANYVNLCMQDFGTLEPGMTFYGNSKGTITYEGSSSQKAATKAMVEKNYNIIKVGGKKAVKAGLKPGDICIFKGHTNVFACLNSEGVPVWYDAGRNSTSDGKPQSGYFTNMYRACYYNSMPIYYVLRLKK